MSSSSSSATTSTHQNSAFTQQSLDTSKKTSTPIAVNIRASPVSQVSFQKPIPYDSIPLFKNHIIFFIICLFVGESLYLLPVESA